jgi:tetratricopeptide (TPR) repeat protein
MENKPEIYLKRAWGLINEVEKATDTFREQAIQHDAQVQEDQPLVGSLVTMFRSAGKLKREKGSLLRDLELATSEISKAATLNPDAVIRTNSAEFDIVTLQATTLYLRGQIEMIWGKPERAKDIWFQSVNLREFADPHYMLGLLYEDEYNPKEALNHFERCLELDPDGDLSVPALREANAMRNYKKKFRGSWPLFGFMFFFFFPVAIVYLVVKYK